MNLSDDLFFHYVERVRRHDDEMSLVIKGHLLVEFALNWLIERELQDAKSIISNSNQYTFSVKLQILWSARLIPDYIYKNVRRINVLRNEYAHRLKPNEAKIDWLISDCSASGEVIDITAKVKGMRVANRERKYVKTLCSITLIHIRNFCLEKYGHNGVRFHF